MNRTEFNDWWKRYRTAFPDASSAIARADDQGTGLLNAWLEAFGDVNFTDACEVVKLMVRGDVEAIKGYAVGETAAVIRRHARDLAHQRETANDSPPWRNHERRTERMTQGAPGNAVQRDPGMRAALDALLQMRAAGASPGAQREMLESRFPKMENDRRERYFCVRCVDTGLVRVWSVHSIRACLEGKLDEKNNRKTAVMPCTCAIGQRKLVLDDRSRTAFRRRFDDKLDCECVDPDDLEAIAALEEWCEARQNAKPDNYEPAFDDYNAREF